MTTALPEQPDGATPAPQKSPADRPHKSRSWALVLFAVAVLGWLYWEADAISISEHQKYTRELGWLRQGDAEFNAAILVSHFGMRRDFDAITASVVNIQRIMRALDAPPSFLAEADRALLRQRLLEFNRQQAKKTEAVDHYKREISLLRNSVAYFPSAADDFVEQTRENTLLARSIGILARGVTTFALNGDPALRSDLLDRARTLQRQAADSDATASGRLSNLLAHAVTILERKPVLDALTHDILALPTAQISNELTRLYADGYERAARRAHIHRVLLFVCALGLAGYLILAFTRLGRASQALTSANSDLENQIEALHRAQEQLNLYATVFTNAAEGMTITDAQTQIVAVNPAFTRITGYTLTELIGRKPSVLRSARQDGEFYRELWHTLNERGQWQGEIWNRRSSGEIYPEWLSITAVHNGMGSATHYIGIFSDITERKEAEARIHHISHHDALTNLPNRLMMQARLHHVILQSQHTEQRAAVLLLDLDRFKTINDTLGHEIGDALLIQVTQRCLAVLRNTDTFARQGGDEFVALLHDLGQTQDAALIARKILASFAQPFELGSHALTVTASIGIALYPDDGADESILLRNADAAMYRAKANGRNCFQFYSADMNTASLGELLLENQLRGAIERDELQLHYQLKVDAATHRLTGAEALLRWQHPQMGLLSPDRFIPVAEESGLIVPIGEWVIQQACRQLRAWMDAGLAVVPIAVNMSAQQFAQQDVVGIVRDALAENELPPSLLELELTETMLMRDLEHTIDILCRLSEMNITLSIDDFGSGYSSLAYLRRFQVNVLKIDRSFVRDIQPDGSNGQIAAAIIALAHNLGQEVVAEGVETNFQRDFLIRHGCNKLQGFLFGRPQPAADFARRLAAASHASTAAQGATPLLTHSES